MRARGGYGGGTERPQRQVLLQRARHTGLGDRALLAMAFLLERGTGTIREMEVALNVNRRTLQRDLKRCGRPRQRGRPPRPADPTRHYEPLLRQAVTACCDTPHRLSYDWEEKRKVLGRS